MPKNDILFLVIQWRKLHSNLCICGPSIVILEFKSKRPIKPKTPNSLCFASSWNQSEEYKIINSSINFLHWIGFLMTYYAPEPHKQWKTYTWNIWACVENDTCSLFCLYPVPQVSKNYEISCIRSYNKLLGKKNHWKWRANVKVMAKINWDVCSPVQEPGPPRTWSGLGSLSLSPHA